jgi:hypothetical protein
MGLDTSLSGQPAKAHIIKISLLVFHRPNYDAAIECTLTCTSADNLPRHEKIMSDNHVTMKINQHRAVDDVMQIAQ